MMGLRRYLVPLLPVLAGLLITSLAVAIYSALDLGADAERLKFAWATRSDPAVLAREQQALWTWAVSDLILLVTASYIFVATAYLIARNRATDRGRYQIFGGLLVASVLFASAVYLILDQTETHTVGTMNSLFNDTFTLITSKEAIWALLNIGNSLGLTITVLILAGLSVTLCSSGGALTTDKSALARSTLELWHYVYMAAAFFIVSVMEVHALHRLPGALLASPDDAKTVYRFAATISAIYGLFYTGVLAGAVLPAAIALRVRAMELARLEGGDDAQEIEKWLRENRLEVTRFVGIGRVVAVLGPVLAGFPLQELLNIFGG